MDWFDRNPNIVSWASEELIIPYKSPIDGRWHRYFPDFLVKTKTKTLLIEVKPKKQTKPPPTPRRVTQRYITEVTTWGVNEAKWKAAIEYCKDRAWEFKIVTEDDLGL